MKTLQDIVKAGNLTGYFQNVATAVTSVLPSIDGDPKNRCYFILLVADDTDSAHYVSNANRQDCIKWMRETADRLESEDQERKEKKR